MIRNASRAIVLCDGHILLQKLRFPDGHIEYALPGGGQNEDETMEEAVIRECREETGYAVRLERFVALFEEIITTDNYRRQYPERFHRIFNIFLCTTDGKAPLAPSEQDMTQVDIKWVALQDMTRLRTWHDFLSTKLLELIATDHPVYMGTCRKPSSWIVDSL